MHREGDTYGEKQNSAQLELKAGMGIGYNFDGDQNQSKNLVRPKCREKAKKIQLLPRHTINDEKNPIPSQAHEKKRKYILLGQNL